MRKQSKKRLKVILVRFFLFVFCGTLFLLFFQVWRFVKHSRFFLVTSIETNLDASWQNRIIRSRALKTVVDKQSIFSVDLGDVSSKLKEDNIEFKDVIVQRKFPNTLHINFIQREPFTQVEINGRFWLLDKEFIVLREVADVSYPDKIIIYPLLPKGLEVVAGTKLSMPYAERVSFLIEQIYSQNLAQNYDIKSLYAYSLNGIYFDLNGVSIRVGSDQYDRKIKLLKELILPKFSNDLDRIEYVDLRFKDYVIGYKR